ncbi:hypothetical protein Tco_1086181 [Tanacetum coccineum]
MSVFRLVQDNLTTTLLPQIQTTIVLIGMELEQCFAWSLNEQSFSELPSSAQPDSMRKTQPFSEAALSEAARSE